MSVVLALQALEGQLMRKVLYRVADLLRNLLSQRTLDSELLGQLPQHRN